MVISNPSTITRGAFKLLDASFSASSKLVGKLEFPRMVISTSLLGLLPRALSITMLIEGSIFRKVLNKFWPRKFFNSFAETVFTAPVKLSLGRLKIPVTTTSSISVTSSSRTTKRGLKSLICTSRPFIPIKENCKTPPSSGKVNSNFPSTSVTTPNLVSFTNTVTPGRGSPSLSVTRPSIFFPSCSSVRLDTSVNSRPRVINTTFPSIS